MQRYIKHVYLPLAIMGAIAFSVECLLTLIKDKVLYDDLSLVSAVVFGPFASWLTAQPFSFWFYQQGGGDYPDFSLWRAMQYAWPTVLVYQAGFFLLMAMLDRVFVANEKEPISMRVTVAELCVFALIVYALGCFGAFFVLMTSGQRLS